MRWIVAFSLHISLCQIANKLLKLEAEQRSNEVNME